MYDICIYYFNNILHNYIVIYNSYLLALSIL